jgi:hypothetical protein
MPDGGFRVLAIATHPVPYAAPLLRRMAARPEVDFRVAYCTLCAQKPRTTLNLAQP